MKFLPMTKFDLSTLITYKNLEKYILLGNMERFNDIPNI
jgi:hypothetical protein